MIEAARRYGIPQRDVIRWLAYVPAWARHKPVRRVPPHRNYDPRPATMNHTWHLDTFFIPDDKNPGKKLPYLICVDALSRFVHVRKLDNQTALAAAKAFRYILRQAKVQPAVAYTDGGVEFRGAFGGLLRSLGIRHHVARGESKAFMAERQAKEVKIRLFRRATYLGIPKYAEAVQTMVKNINRSVNSSTQVAPANVRPRHAWDIWVKSVESHTPTRKPRYRAGQHVRVSHDVKKDFRKGFMPTYGSEVFTVHRVLPGHPYPLYELQDGDNNIILGVWYESELQPILKPEIN